MAERTKTYRLITPTKGERKRPFIAGTRIAVDDIVASYRLILDSKVIPELQAWFPHLTEEQIREALDYYRENPDQINRKLRDDREFRRTPKHALAT